MQSWEARVRDFAFLVEVLEPEYVIPLACAGLDSFSAASHQCCVQASRRE